MASNLENLPNLSKDSASLPNDNNKNNFNNALVAASPPSVLNAQNAAANNNLPPSFSFRPPTIGPSPPLPNAALADPSASNTSLVSDLISSCSSSTADDQIAQITADSLFLGGGTSSLRAVPPPNTPGFFSVPARKTSALSPGRAPIGITRKSSAQSLRSVSRTASVRAAIESSIGTASVASSACPSPIISAMGEVTPLPSPLLSSDSPGPWKRLASSFQLPGPAARPTSRDGLLPVPSMPDSVLVSRNGESISAALANHAKRKVFTASLSADTGEPKGQMHATSDGRPPPQPQQHNQHPNKHTRTRSTSEYIPDSRLIPQRHPTVPGAHQHKAVSMTSSSPSSSSSSAEPHMRREPHLSEARGITPAAPPVEKPPTPPPSEPSDSAAQRAPAARKPELFEAHGRNDMKLRRWRAVKYLGQGTFSKVILATSQTRPIDGLGLGYDSESSETQDGIITPTVDSQLDRKTLVAIKICEHGPRGGASEDRIEMSLKRELEILRSIEHPSLAHLKAWNIEPTRALLVLSYCPGGDLFDVASAYKDVLSPILLRRIFSELVGAVRYLHDLKIVHRDIKLENVLVNLTPGELANPSMNWLTYPYSITTLADLGLSRRVADDEKLNTRCGSDDYAAPEVILGQSYDGRATDAWSLGVLLYALVEGRLPFDPNPSMTDAHRMRSRTSHRIARVDWRWIEFAGEDGDHEANEAKFAKMGLTGAMEITEGLLKRPRSRLTMESVAKHEWVDQGIQAEGGLKFREEVNGEEVS